MANRLQFETSPYLLQHAENPVDWYPWGKEALQAAKEQDKPILLSIGYSACHWCHVMERESFQNERIAQIMNEHFINIKVDREERPDLDAIYMIAVQMLTGGGGWPMTVFLTPEGRPFYGGTYFPPEDRPGMPGFPRVLTTIANAYREQREQIEQSAEEIQGHLQQHFSATVPPAALSAAVLDDAARNLAGQFDRENGGFAGAPKFPPAMPLEFLLRTWLRTGSARALEMVEQTLVKMARGGIFDQIGGGFHRYTVDAIWLVPHFEKMLYDNALLARVYTLAYQATGHALYRAIAEETLEYVLREMTSPEGGFYTTQDADSEGEEGKFYVWTPAEIEAAVGAEAAPTVERYYGVTAAGNFEGKNILHVPEEPAAVAEELGLDLNGLARILGPARLALYQARAKRVWPGRDEKVLTAWNGLMLRAMAEAATVFERDDLRQAAVRNATLLRDRLWHDGRLRRSYKDGEARLNGYLKDYAMLANGLVSLYEATFDAGWIAWARELVQVMETEFWDDAEGGYFDTAESHETLIARPKDAFDSAIPSGNSVAAEVLLRLHLLTGEEQYRQRAIAILEKFGALAAQHPVGFGHFLCAYDLALAPSREIALVGDPADPATQALLAAVQRPYLPHTVVALRHPGAEDESQVVPLLADRTLVDGRPAAYVCQDFVCQLPVTDADALIAQLS